MSNYDQPIPDITDNDLNFGVEAPMYPIVVNPRDTLYVRFWGTYVLELYSTEARVLSCNMNLTEADLQSWSFNDKIYIKDTYYRILSISYDANAPGTAQVELIRKLDDITLCSDTPTGMFGQVIIFNNSGPGSLDFGNQTCCEFYGYDWRLYKQSLRCMPKNAQLSI